MISEETQDQTALYALGLLDADEAAALERALAADGELRTLTVELREAAAALARTDTGDVRPPPELKARLLAQLPVKSGGDPAEGKVVAGPGFGTRWLPWAAAAMLAICCGVLGWRVSVLNSAYQQTRDALGDAEVQRLLASPAPQTNSLRQVSYCPLEPVPAAQQTLPQAGVLWDAVQRRGRLQLQKLPPAGTGKDYQLWAVEAGHKNPISAGVVKVDADGGAAVEFRPGPGDDAQAPVTAFALSVERAGGVPQNEGPIVFVGQLQP